MSLLFPTRGSGSDMDWAWKPDEQDEGSCDMIMEAILISPQTFKPLAKSREIIPSSEISYGQSILYITAEKNAEATITKAGGEVKIRKRLPDELRDWHIDLSMLIPYASQIVFDFSLLENGKLRRFTRDEERLMENIFKDTWAVDMYSNFLVIRVNRIPHDPWPFAVADLPLHLTTSRDNSVISLGERGHGAAILSSFKYAIDTKFTTLAGAVQNHFFTNLGNKLVRTVWTGEAFSITMLQHCHLGALPRSIAGRRAFYSFDFPTVARQEAAFPLFFPKGPTVRDDSSYGRNLCPGVMLSSGEPHEFLSTSGIAVVDDKGHKFVTVSSYGFPEIRKDVYHSQGRTADPIARLELMLPDLGIGLAKLHRGMSYTSWLFNHEEPSTGAQPEIAIMADTPILSVVQMNSPFVGNVRGILISRTVEHLDSKLGNGPGVPLAWIWYGVGTDHLLHGACGTPVMVGDKILGLFHYFDHQLRVGCVLEAEVLLARGYKVTGIRLDMDHGNLVLRSVHDQDMSKSSS